jgi:hypothetical protein
LLSFDKFNLQLEQPVDPIHLQGSPQPQGHLFLADMVNSEQAVQSMLHCLCFQKMQGTTSSAGWQTISHGRKGHNFNRM